MNDPRPAPPRPPRHVPDEAARANMSDDPGPVSPHQEDIAGQERDRVPIPTQHDRDEQYSGGRTGNA